MNPLLPELRKLLENAIPNVRERAERAAEALLNTYAVNRPDPFQGMTDEQRRMRNGLRARARQLGNGVMAEGLGPLKSEIAYEQWHRMVFARFLAENGLLRHSSGVAVTLQDCAELAIEEGEADAWATAAKYASEMLPGIFRPEDPAAQLRLAPEGRNALESMLNGFPGAVFTSDDALGWMYQFWQSKKKKEVNDSERKIGGADIAPVTQLFTEDYMVRFLLENSLGAWWAGRHPDSPLVKRWEYLRFKEDGTPAAGTFPGWPQTAAEVSLMDPCCGSGHFLVAGFNMQVEMRMEEEGLGEAEAAEAVLRDNIFGLELDPRCTQIAAFALALASWKRGGYRQLPVPNVACSGIPVQGQLETWLKLAGKDTRLRAALERLYRLFSDAPDLGSLINPADLSAADHMFMADYEQVAPVLEQALAKERDAADPVAEIFGTAAEGVAKAARLLAGKYTLVITNVPYLSRGKQNDVLKEYCDLYHPKAKADLATAFVERCISFSQVKGTTALVTPQYWLFLSKYEKLRIPLLKTQRWDLVAKMGAGAFQTIGGAVVNVALLILTNSIPSHEQRFAGLDVNEPKNVLGKQEVLLLGKITFPGQLSQLKNPSSCITLKSVELSGLLSAYADSYHGISTTDYPRFGRCYWELSIISDDWEFQQSTVVKTINYGGREHILYWQKGYGGIKELAKQKATVVITGLEAWSKKGVAVSQMGDLPVTIYLGGPFDDNTAVIIPKKENYLGAIWAFCSSNDYAKVVRSYDQSFKVTYPTLVKIPFELDRWQKVAKAAGPLPEPHSDDPTQSLFNGHVVGATAPLQVAVARLLGYHWPQQAEDDLNNLADDDGIACLPSVCGEAPLVERLRGLLVHAYGDGWVSERTEPELVAGSGTPGKSLDEWLREDFFAQHSRMFHSRPFIWHIWDGRKDGFSALVNYHKLDATRLDKLIFTYLGDWIRFQHSRRDHGESGADGRLVAALELEKKLKLIKEGEPPNDIYVRWKSLSQQPMGWNPDLNDGVRLNIRPFITAGVLRSHFTINWNKDRGKNPDGSERLNDLHYTLAEKRSAR
jgi:hypothetical protein